MERTKIKNIFSELLTDIIAKYPEASKGGNMHLVHIGYSNLSTTFLYLTFLSPDKNGKKISAMSDWIEIEKYPNSELGRQDLVNFSNEIGCSVRLYTSATYMCDEIII